MNTVKEAFRQELITLEKARDILQYSYDKCYRRKIVNRIVAKWKKIYLMLKISKYTG